VKKRIFVILSFLFLVPYLAVSQDHTQEYYDNGYQLLYMADSGSIADVHNLIETKGADVNFFNEDGVTALMFAAQAGHDTIVKYLISKGADVNAKSTYFKFSPLISAVKNDYLRTAEILIRNGANIDDQDVFERTALHYTAMYGFDASADMLLYYDANPEVKDVTEYTHVCYAVEEHQDTILQILLNKGVDTDVRVRDSSTLFHLAAGTGNLYFLEQLKEEYYSSKNNNGLTPVDVAVVAGQSEVLEWFLENGFTQTDTINGIYTARTLARSSGDTETKKLVRKMKIKDVNYLYLRRLGLGYDMIFNGDDFFMSMGALLAEDRYGFTFETGLIWRPGERRIWYPIAEDEYYQLREKRTAYYFVLRKNFKLFNIDLNSYVSAFASIRGAYYFGEHDGYLTPVTRELKASPSIGIMYNYGESFRTYFYCDYLDLYIYDTAPLFYSIGMQILMDFRKNETNEKYKYIIKY